MDTVIKILELTLILFLIILFIFLIKSTRDNREMIQYAIDNQSMAFYQIYSVQQDLRVIRDFTGAILEITNQ